MYKELETAWRQGWDKAESAYDSFLRSLSSEEERCDNQFGLYPGQRVLVDMPLYIPQVGSMNLRYDYYDILTARDDVLAEELNACAKLTFRMPFRFIPAGVGGAPMSARFKDIYLPAQRLVLPYSVSEPFLISEVPFPVTFMQILFDRDSSDFSLETNFKDLELMLTNKIYFLSDLTVIKTTREVLSYHIKNSTFCNKSSCSVFGHWLRWLGMDFVRLSQLEMALSSETPTYEYSKVGEMEKFNDSALLFDLGNVGIAEFPVNVTVSKYGVVYPIGMYYMVNRQDETFRTKSYSSKIETPVYVPECGLAGDTADPIKYTPISTENYTRFFCSPVACYVTMPMKTLDGPYRPVAPSLISTTQHTTFKVHSRSFLPVPIEVYLNGKRLFMEV